MDVQPTDYYRNLPGHCISFRKRKCSMDATEHPECNAFFTSSLLLSQSLLLFLFYRDIMRNRIRRPSDIMAWAPRQ